MKHFVWALLLLSCCASLASAQDTAALKRVITGNGDALEKCLSSQELGRFYAKQRQPEEGLEWLDKGLPFAKKCGNDSLLANHYELLGDLCNETFAFELAVEHYQKALAIKEKLPNKLEVGHAYYDLGIAYGNLEDNVKQTELYIRAQKIYREMGDRESELAAAAGLANVYRRQKNPKASIAAYRPLLPELEKEGMYQEIQRAYANMAVCFMDLKEKDSTFRYARLEIAAARKTDDLVDRYESWNRFSGYCTVFKEFDEYRPAVDSMLHYANLLDNNVRKSGTYSQLGLYDAMVKHDFRAALKNFEESLRYAQLQHSKPQIITALVNIASCYQSLDDYENAFDYLSQAYAMKDSIITDAGQEKIIQMQTRYQTEKKEAQIQLLDNENKLQQRTAYFLIAGLGLLALAGLSLYRNNRIKQKNNRRLQQLNSALDEANQSKAKLFSILSHDLRSPVSDLFSYLQLQKIAPQLLTEEKKQAKQEQLYQSTDHLLNSMEDLLLWSKSQMESFVPDKTSVSLKQLVEEVTGIYQQAVGEKRLSLVLPEGDASAMTDENMLKTILRNLVNNAVKFTTAGGDIRISLIEKTGGSQALQIFNSGTPMSAEMAAGIFSWAGLSSSQSGYGLKLSKELADTLGLSIQAIPQKDGNLFSIHF